MTTQRTYIPNNRRPSSPDIMTRIQQDLSTSPHQEKTVGVSKKEEMLRRTVGKIPHVGIVGAGVAGLRCADLLHQHDVTVTILEARDRVGGRLCQSDALGHTVDLGPNWIHGTDNNPILDLAKETNTMTMSWDGRQAMFDKQGRPMSHKEAEENFEIVWSLIEQAMTYSNEHSATIPVDKSLYDYFEEKVKTMIPSEMGGDEQAEKKRETILSMAELWGAFVGSRVQRQSLKYFWMEECIDGENLFVAETYKKVLAKIAERGLDEADVWYGYKVSKIVSKGTEENPTVVVESEFEEKETMAFDELVMTAPLGWLKRNDDVFVPALPNRLKQAIASIGYGNLDKVYFTFPSAFWNESTPSTRNGTTQIAHDHSIPNVTATTVPLHQAPEESQPTPNPEHHPGFTHWMQPTYASETNPSQWAQEALNMAALPSPTAHPTLLFYTYGPTSLHIASLLKNHPTPTNSPEAMALLTPFFQPYFSRLPNYSATNPLHQPSGILATAWANDEFAGYGSYSNFQIGLERGEEDVEVMRRGVPERGLWLAGEHTSPFVALGTVTGAWWAGEGVARRILRAYGLEKNGEGEESNGHAIANGGT